MAENPMSDREYATVRRMVKPFSRLNAFVYRLSGGRLLGRFSGRDICLVTMTGARSGKQRTVPLMYVPYEDGVIIVASLGGAPKHPVWYYNLVKHPDIEVQYRDRKLKLRARLVDPELKAKLWPTCVEYYPPYEDYQKRTDRDIPVFLCEPRG